MDLLIRTSIRNGYTPITTPGRSETRLIEFGIVTLDEGEEYSIAGCAQERVAVILGGRCDILGNRFGWKRAGERHGVFQGKATAFYLPPGYECRIIARTRLSIALAGVEADISAEPIFIEGDNVTVSNFGRGFFAWQVHNIFDDSHLAGRMRVGEQFTPAGHSSSYPPHSHTEGTPPGDVEELCFFNSLPHQGFGYMRVYTGDHAIDETYCVRENDAVIIPRGFHTITAVPGYQLYCLFVHAGSCRHLKVDQDPKHNWIV